MKKITSLLLIACLAFGVLGAATVSAADNEVLKGTPVVDGKVDDIYKQSMTITYAGADKNATGQKWADDTMTAYALYDDDYLYLVADVKDDDVVSADKDWIMSNANPYQNDVIEFRLNYKGESGVQFKVGVDAFGYKAYTLQANACDISKVIYKTTVTDDGYVVEVAIPATGVDGSSFIDSGKLGLKIWWFDLQEASAGKAAPADNSDVYQYSMLFGTTEEGGNQGNPVFYTLSDKEAAASTTPAETEKADDTTKAEDTTKAQDTTKAEDTTKAAEQTEAPATFDAFVIAAVVASAAAAGIVVSKKRR